MEDAVELGSETEAAREAIYELLASSLDQAMRLVLDTERQANAEWITSLCGRVGYLAQAAERIGTWPEPSDRETREERSGAASTRKTAAPPRTRRRTDGVEAAL